MSSTRLGIFSALVLAACPKGARVPACAASETNRCSCATGGEGLQACLPSGEAFGACVCSSACANGAACVSMPSLVGKDLDSAGALLDQAQLLLPDPVDPKGFITEQEISDPPVQILAQDPPAGTPVKPGTRVALTVTLPPDQETLGLPNANFLVGHLTQDTGQSAQSYYDTLDPGPFPTRATLADWKSANGFGTPADAEASALYVTHTDLGFGRHMHMRRQGRRVAFYVDNYPGIEDAIAGTRFFATVAMEWSPGPHGKDTDPYFTQFYAFNKKGERISDPILDDHGPKQMPAVCLVCHGGNTSDLTYQSNGGKLGAHFIPFDVDAEQFLDRPGYTRADQEWAFKAFNESVQGTWDPADPSYPPGDPPPALELIDGWYGGPGHPSATFQSGATPAAWDVSPESHALYHQVFARSCQTCHAQREAYRNFSTYAKFTAVKPLIRQRVFDEGAMPLSQRGFLNFWLSYPEQPKILATWLGAQLQDSDCANPSVVCPPGRPLVHVSVSPGVTVTAGTAVLFDASGSQYAVTFKWQQTSGPTVQLANAAVDGSKVTFVTPALGANLGFELVISALGHDSAPYPLNVLSRSAPSAPQSVAATAGASSATVSWAAPASDGLSPITGYTVTASPGGSTLSAGAAATSAQVNGLLQGVSYLFSVAAVNAIGTGPAASTGSVRIPTVPGPPVGVSAVSTNTGGTLRVSWTAPADDGGAALSGYAISCSPAGTATAPGAATSADVSGLANGTAYACTVVAQNVAGNSAASQPSASAIPRGPPGPPQNFTATNTGPATWSLSWNPPSDTGGLALSGYILSWTPVTSGSPKKLLASATSTTLGPADGLLSTSTYAFSLSAVNSIGTGVAATTTPPGKPGITSATPAPNQITVTWTAAAPNGSTITQYVAQATQTTSPFTVISAPAVPGTQLSTTITGLSNCTAYNVTVTATSGGGSTTSDPVTNITPLQAPDVPTPSLPTQGPGVGDFNFAWSAPNGHGCGPIHYNVKVTDPVNGVLPLMSTSATNISYTTTNPACPYPTVNCSTPRTWGFQVQASTGGGTSAFSTTVNGTPRLGYVRDSLHVIWSTVLPTNQTMTCLNCHTSGNPLILSDGTDTTHSTSWNNIRNTANVVILTPSPSPGSSFLHLCPTQSAGCTPVGGFTNHPGGQRYPVGSPEDNVVVQWITDGALF